LETKRVLRLYIERKTGNGNILWNEFEAYKFFWEFWIGRIDLVRRKDKYLPMTIDSKTNMPTHIPHRCTSKIDFRCYPEVKERVMAMAEENKTSQTKIILKALDIYWKVIN
jgi:hypothetical protein